MNDIFSHDLSALPDFFQLEDALQRVDAGFSASEVHGIACGVLAVDNAAGSDRWMQHVLKGDAQDFYVQEATTMLADVHQATLRQLNNDDMHVELCLPDDQTPIWERVTALQKWCQGFAFGLAASGLESIEGLPDDPKTWVKDVIEIGAANDLSVDDDEASEASLLELQEYLRVGVLMMNEELQPLRGTPHSEGGNGEQTMHIH